MIRKLLVLFSVLLIIFAPALLIRADEIGLQSVDLVILHINDTHGRLMPYETKDGKSVGGIARQATLIKKIRSENKGRVLLLHAGDIFSRGDAFTVYYGGEVNLAAMEIIGYDAFTPGNGEFYFGIKNLCKQTKRIKFPTLLANVVYKKNNELIFQPYIIKEVAGVKIAILGLGFIREEHPSAWPLILKDPIEMAREYVPLLKERADVVVALTHIGLTTDKKLATEVPQIDIIIGGHSHSKLDTPLRFPRLDDKGETIVVQAGLYEQFLGRLELQMLKSGTDTKYQIAKIEGRLLPIDSEIDEDPEVTKLLERYSEKLKEVLLTSEVALNNPNSGNSPMGNFVVSALHSQTNADVALLDRGAVRSGIERGDVTIADITQIHPWRNEVVRLRLTGTQLQQLLAKHDILTAGCSFQKPCPRAKRRNVLEQSEGIEDKLREEGIEGEIKDLKIGGKPVDPERRYKVVAGEYLVGTTPSLCEMPFDKTIYRVDTILQIQLRQMGAKSILGDGQNPFY